MASTVNFYQKHFSNKSPKPQTGFGGVATTPNIGYTEEVEIKGVTAAGANKKKPAERKKPAQRKNAGERKKPTERKKRDETQPVKKKIVKKTRDYPFFSH